MIKDTTQSILLPIKFGENFFADYAGRLIDDPRIAIVELVANSWDAGSKTVKISWPESGIGPFDIIDNGTGMTKEEFETIWTELNYNRVKNQGHTIQLPSDKMKMRKVYGRNGKGRHSLFCFSNRYIVETCKNGECSQFQVTRTMGKNPYEILFMGVRNCESNGTKISCEIIKNHILAETVQELLGSKFIADPSFEIFVNSQKLDPLDILTQSEMYPFSIPNEGEIQIYIIDSKKTGRISKHHGVAWWVNNRLVGEHSWKGLEGAYLDGRSSEAKRFTIIVKADILENEIKPDWSGFFESSRAQFIKDSANEFILETIKMIMQDARKSAKKGVLFENRARIRDLSPLSKEHVGKFIDEIQMKCPTMTQKDLSKAIEIFSNMELNRSGYYLLQQLASVPPDDLDRLSTILESWNLMEAKVVLDELDSRLKLINRIESVLENSAADELHELHPLFEKGLWIFGPEYEGVQYLSNKSLLKIVNTFLGGGPLQNPLRRPDFVVFPNQSVGIFSCDRYDEIGEVCGLQKILIIELKKSNSKISEKERRQAEDYAKEIRKSQKIDKSTEIVCFVLGEMIDCDPIDILNTHVIPRPYNTILRQANARTFNLIDKIKRCKNVDYIGDEEIKEVLYQQEISEQFF